MNELYLPMIVKDPDRYYRITAYLKSLPEGTWYWTMRPLLFTFEDEEDELIFRLACDY